MGGDRIEGQDQNTRTSENENTPDGELDMQDTMNADHMDTDSSDFDFDSRLFINMGCKKIGNTQIGCDDKHFVTWWVTTDLIYDLWFSDLWFRNDLWFMI